MEKFINAIILGIIGMFFVCAVALLLAFPLKWTWNGVMPYLFGLKEIGVVQAFCLSFVAGCLIKPSFSSSSKSD